MSTQPAEKADAFGAIDTSLDDVTTGLGMDAPDIDNMLPSVDLETFTGAMQDGTGGLSFSQMMKQLSQAPAPAAGPGVDGYDTGTATGTRADVVAYAKKFLGMQYKWGGSNPSTSFDCSGFTQYVLGHFGVHLPRVSYQQNGAGEHVPLGQLQAGDLVTWDNSSRNNGADHVALYMGNGQIMEFSRPGRPSRIRKLGKNEGATGVHIKYGKG
jgi:cell wall-associated NlpC family hydrolase